MKVYIGPYKNYYSVYAFLESLRFIPERYHDAIVDSLFGGILVSIFDAINEVVPDRTVKVRIDKYDTWSMDHTLAKIIHPMLVQLKNDGDIIGIVKNEDVPEELRLPDEDKAYFSEAEHEEVLLKRWHYIIDEMIWAFKEIASDYKSVDYGAMTEKELDAYHERYSKGAVLFGKYYSQLWS